MTHWAWIEDKWRSVVPMTHAYTNHTIVVQLDDGRLWQVQSWEFAEGDEAPSIEPEAPGSDPESLRAFWGVDIPLDD